MHPESQSALEWYLSEGSSLFERSPTGAILDLLAMQAYVTYPCDRYDCVSGILESGAWCPRCNGTGVIPMHQPRRSDDGCECVRLRTPTHQGRSSLDDERLVAYSVIARRLSRLPERLADALRLAYGDQGAVVAKTRRGRSWAVAPLTTAGSKLLQGATGEARSPIRALTELADIDDLKPPTKRNPLLHQARVQAEALLATAERAWDERDH